MRLLMNFALTVVLVFVLDAEDKLDDVLESGAHSGFTFFMGVVILVAPSFALPRDCPPSGTEMI